MGGLNTGTLEHDRDQQFKQGEEISLICLQDADIMRLRDEIIYGVGRRQE